MWRCGCRFAISSVYLTLTAAPFVLFILVSVRISPFVKTGFAIGANVRYRTVVHNVLVGSVSFASPAKALHNASTAQEITVITPSAHNLSFRVCDFFRHFSGTKVYTHFEAMA